MSLLLFITHYHSIYKYSNLSLLIWQRVQVTFRDGVCFGTHCHTFLWRFSIVLLVLKIWYVHFDQLIFSCINFNYLLLLKLLTLTTFWFLLTLTSSSIHSIYFALTCLVVCSSCLACSALAPREHYLAVRTWTWADRYAGPDLGHYGATTVVHLSGYCYIFILLLYAISCYYCLSLYTLSIYVYCLYCFVILFMLLPFSTLVLLATHIISICNSYVLLYIYLLLSLCHTACHILHYFLFC